MACDPGDDQFLILFVQTGPGVVIAMHKRPAKQFITESRVVFFLGKKTFAFPMTPVTETAKRKQAKLIFARHRNYMMMQ
jgi:hypothetical protein